MLYGAGALQSGPRHQREEAHALRETLTIKETAARLGIGRALCYEMARRGEIPAIRLGRRIVVPERALMAFLALQNFRGAA